MMDDFMGSPPGETAVGIPGFRESTQLWPGSAGG